MGFLLLSQKWIFEEDASVMVLLTWIAQLILIFAIGYVTNMVINHIWFSEGMSYLNAMRYWGKEPVSECLTNIWTHIYSGLIGGRIHHTIFYGVFVLLAILVSVGNKKENWCRMVLFICYFKLTDMPIPYDGIFGK